MISEEEKEAFDLHVQSDRFFKILDENLSNKITNVKVGNISIKGDSGGEIISIRITDDGRYFKEGSRGAKKIYNVDLRVEISINIMGHPFVRKISEYNKFYIWLIEDNYVVVAYYTHFSDGHISISSLKKMELSEFMKVLKNPLDLL
jgi:hypothetical protein